MQQRIKFGFNSNAVRIQRKKRLVGNKDETMRYNRRNSQLDQRTREVKYRIPDSNVFLSSSSKDFDETDNWSNNKSIKGNELVSREGQEISNIERAQGL